MNDAERLAVLTHRLNNLDGLDKDTFDRISTALDRGQSRLGYDVQGRLKVAFFDARSYDRESFDKANEERYALRYISASLDRNNVVVTSHQAFLTHEALANITDTTLENIGEFNAGRRGSELINAVRLP